MAKERVTIEDLARMVQDGFSEIKREVGDLRSEVRQGFAETNQRLTIVEQNQESLKLRQDNVAHRFELDALDQRVSKLEKTR